jgi:hypothetical protein
MFGVGSGVAFFTGGNPWAVGMAAYGYDTALAGAEEMLTGEDAQTYLEKGVSGGLQAVGVDKGTADTAAAVGHVTAGIVLGGGSLKPAREAAKKAAAKAESAAEDVAEGAAKKGKEGIDEAAEKSGKEGAEECADEAAEAGDDVAEGADDAAEGAGEAAAKGAQGLDLDAFSAAGRAPAKGGRTAAGRAYQKHMDRGELPSVPGNSLDHAGQDLLDGILFRGLSRSPLNLRSDPDSPHAMPTPSEYRRCDRVLRGVSAYS